MQDSKTVKCPECGKDIQLIPKAGDPDYLQGFCNCRGGRSRAVYQIHNSLLNKKTETKKKKEALHA